MRKSKDKLVTPASEEDKREDPGKQPETKLRRRSLNKVRELIRPKR